MKNQKKFSVSVQGKGLDILITANSAEEALNSYLHDSVTYWIEPEDILEVKEKKIGGGQNIEVQAKSLRVFHERKKRHAEFEEKTQSRSNEGTAQKYKLTKDEHEEFIKNLSELETLLESTGDEALCHIDLYVENAFFVVDANVAYTENDEEELKIRKKVYYKSLRNEVIRAAIETHQMERGRRTFLSVMQQLEGLAKGIGSLQEEIGRGNKTRTTAALAGALFATEGVNAIRDLDENEGFNL